MESLVLLHHLERSTEWPVLRTTLKHHTDHVQSQKDEPQLATLAGKAFKSGSTRDLDKEVRKGLVNMKLECSKKAGTASNQTAAAGTALLRHLHMDGRGYAPINLSWTGQIRMLFNLQCRNN